MTPSNGQADRLGGVGRGGRRWRKGGVTQRANGAGIGMKLFLSIFFSFFLFGGLGFLWFLFVKPGLVLLDAQDWPSVPATVTSSQLGRHVDSDGDATYSIEISFVYEYQGQPYTSDTYDAFSSMGSSGYSGKKKIVDRYPIGQATTAYVNPQAPGVALLYRGWNHIIWFSALPLVFVLVGGGGIVGLLWKSGREGWATKDAQRSDRVGLRAQDDWLPWFARSDERGGAIDGRARSDANTVSPTGSRWGKLIAAAIFAVIWNTIVGFIAFKLFGEDANENLVSLLFFSIAFGGVGVGALVVVVYLLLAMTNPVVRMHFDPRVMTWGEPLRVAWSIEGQVGRFRRLTVTVEGAERATYTRGTDRVTDEYVFFEHTLYDAEAMNPRSSRDPLSREGEAELKLPENAMHSLELPNNDIVWRIKVEGDIPRWPDLKDTYEFAIVPPPPEIGTNQRGMF